MEEFLPERGLIAFFGCLCPVSGIFFLHAGFFPQVDFRHVVGHRGKGLLVPDGSDPFFHCSLLVIYHFVIEGRASARLEGGPSLSLVPGDVVVFPHGDPHVVWSGEESAEPRETSAIIQKVLTRDLTALRAGGGGNTTRFVCGFMSCDPNLSRPILDGLPQTFKVNVRKDGTGQWLENSILHLVEEAGSGRVGSEAMLAKVSEALFVDTLRRYVMSLPERETGWLSGARDPIVGKCLGLMHSRVDHPWTIAKLASGVGMSRSALSDRFSRYLSEGP